MATTGQAKQVVARVFAAYMDAPSQMPMDFGSRANVPRAVADYIAGMTDRFAAREHERLTRTQAAGLRPRSTKIRHPHPRATCELPQPTQIAGQGPAKRSIANAGQHRRDRRAGGSPMRCRAALFPGSRASAERPSFPAAPAFSLDGKTPWAGDETGRVSRRCAQEDVAQAARRSTTSPRAGASLTQMG